MSEPEYSYQRRRARLLAVTLPIVGLAIGMAFSAKPFHKLQQRQWDNAYFRKQVAKRPDLTVAQNSDGWYLIDETVVKYWEGLKEKYGPYAPHYDWHWSVVAEFPRTADQSPSFFEFLPLLAAPLAGGVLMWLIARKPIWVAAAFRLAPKISASARIGMLLVAIWVLCDISEGHYGTRTMTQHFAAFWWNIGLKLNPSQDPNDWPVIPIAMAVLFALPIFVAWTLRPILTRIRSSHKG